MLGNTRLQHVEWAWEAFWVPMLLKMKRLVVPVYDSIDHVYLIGLERWQR